MFWLLIAAEAVGWLSLILHAQETWRIEPARRRYRKIVAASGRLDEVIEVLANDGPLDPRHKDHAMTNTPGVRDCHVAPDLVLLYGQTTDGLLDLYRLGTRSELGI